MTPLRLVDDTGQLIPTDRLPFPAEAAQTMVRERIKRLSVRVDAPASTDGYEAFARELNARLDLAQRQLDTLARDVDAFSFAKYAKNKGTPDTAA